MACGDSHEVNLKIVYATNIVMDYKKSYNNIGGSFVKRKVIYVLLIMVSAFIIAGCNSNKTKLTENVDYSIDYEFPTSSYDITKRGYYIDTYNRPGAPYFYTICMGEQNTGGYSLKIKEVNKIDDKTEVIVEEITPQKDENVTMALTYPTITVEFPKYQENIIIKNTKGEEFVDNSSY